MRVLFVASSGLPGGAELALETYLRHLPAGVEPHALVISPGSVAERLAAVTGRPVAVASLSGRPSPARAGGFVRALAAELRRLRPDVVLATGIKAATLCAPAGRLAGVPVVWHKVDLSHDARLARAVSLLCRGVISVSAAVAEAVPPSRRLAVVPPPVRLDPGFRARPHDGEPVVGSIGRLVPYKGHADVIAATGLLRAEHPGLRVLIAGGEDASAPGHAAELRDLARSCGVELELLGHVDRIEDVYDRLSVLVQATYRDAGGFGGEGFGAALAEASWAGLPVVGTTVGGTGEAVLDGVTGRLVPPRDPRALADAIGGYLTDPAAAAAAGEAGARMTRERLSPRPLAATLTEALARVAR